MWPEGGSRTVCNREITRDFRTGKTARENYRITIEMIEYIYSAESITPEQLEGFFVGWPNPPSPETHLRILRGSAEIILAVDNDSGRVVGFINAVSDGVLCAYIPLLEVLPEYQGKRIGTRLTALMLERLRDLYMIDLLCDSNLQPYYARLGMRPMTGMAVRNYEALRSK